MPIRAFALFALCLLSACAAPQPGSLAVAWPWFSTAQGGVSAPASVPGARGPQYARFNFDWLLDGDPEVMPVQVFDDGARMWLQFPSEGTWPAVFEAAPGGWRPLRYRSEGPYMVLDAVYDRLALRGGHLQGSVSRPSMAATMGTAVPAAAESVPVALPAPVQPAAALAFTDAPRAATAVPAAAASAPVVPSIASSDATSAASAVAPAEAASVATVHIPGVTSAADSAPAVMAVHNESPQVSAGLFSVSPADVTMRQALERWALSVGWVFSPEHWAVDVDIPLVGQASFQADFKSAVRDLLAATEMGDRPLQPCFYSNQVLRVVALSQPCDRRKGMGAVS